MEEIIKILSEITTEQLKRCQEKKIVPSGELLDTIQTLNLLQDSF